MQFSDFAQALFPILAEGRRVEEFTRDIFLNITDYNNLEENPIETAEDGTLRAYYNGRNGITRFAKTISSHLDSQKFEIYLEKFPSGIVLLIRDALHQFNPQIDEYNCYEKCATLFKDIIIAAATQKRRRKSEKAKPIDSTSEQTLPISNKSREDETDVERERHSNQPKSNHDIIKQGVIANLTPALSILGERAAQLTDGMPEKIIASGEAFIEPLSRAEANLASIFAHPESSDSTIRSLCNAPYYHLVVTGGEIYGERYADVSLKRGLRYNGTPTEIIERCADLSDEGVKELLSYPAIICNENTKYRGDTDKNQLAILAKVLRIRKGEDEYRIRFYPVTAFPQIKLNEYAVDFGLCTSRTLTTLNTSHWTVRKNNLLEIFEDVGIIFSRFILLYKSSILQSDLPNGQTNLLLTDFDKLHIGSYITIYPQMYMPHLDNEQVYRITTEFDFDEQYIKGNRTIILSATWNNITITGKMSTENWTSESYMNNCADAGKKTVTAIFKVLNYETNTVQYLLVFEVK